MGIPGDLVFEGVILTLNDIQGGGGSLPGPPNGSWYLPIIDVMNFFRDIAPWEMQYWIGQGYPHRGNSLVEVKHIGLEDTWVFDGETIADGTNDLYVIENKIVSPYESYYGGYATILPITNETLESSLSSIIASLKITNKKVFAEQMGAGSGRRGVRLARQFDGTNAYFKLPPMTSILE